MKAIGLTEAKIKIKGIGTLKDHISIFSGVAEEKRAKEGVTSLL